MNGRKPDGPPSKGSARKARKGAKQRSAKWDQIRQDEAQTSLAESALAPRPSLLEAGRVPWQDKPAASLLLPALVGVLLVGAVMLSLPVLGMPWRPWGIVPLAAAGYLALEVKKSWQRRGLDKRRVSGALVGAGVVVFFTVGLLTQAAPGGQPLLPGTTEERTFTQGQAALTSATILVENAKFLELSSEEIVTLGPLLEEARAQALSIGEAWSPATTQEVPVPAMLEVRARLNRAAVKQAQALEIAQTLAVSPEVALAAQLETLNLETADLLGAGPQSVNAALDQAAQQAGLGERFPRDNT